MSVIETSAALMKQVCLPRKIEWEKPFEKQSVFLYGYDAEEDTVWDGYCWAEGIYINGAFQTTVENLTHWSPCIYSKMVTSSKAEVVALLESLKDGGTELHVTSKDFLVSQHIFFALMYPDPRKMKLEKPQPQVEYYKPIPYTENSYIHELTPLYGFWEDSYGWWMNDGAVKDVTHYLPDCRLESPLLDEIIGDPRESS